MKSIDKKDDSSKSIRGRFVIQEIIDSKSKSSFNSEDIQLAIRDSTKKRRNSLNGSKFKLNSKASLKITKEQFLVYDFNMKTFVDIDDVFYKYENYFNPQIINKFYDNTLNHRKPSLMLSSDTNSLNEEKEESKGILKKGEVKRIESINNISHQPMKEITRSLSKKNTLNFIPKKQIGPPSRKFLSMNDKKHILLEQRVLSLMIESALFNICSLPECQFSV